ncbi:MAG: T9SS type A sorting domain-containing protein [Lentimicrobium sp.]|nr:T9SS type A sorting domain-containing protein [Lentimicrobium sp.]
MRQVIFILVCSILGYSVVVAQKMIPLEPLVVKAVAHDTSPMLRDMPLLPPGPRNERWENEEVPNVSPFLFWRQSTKLDGTSADSDPVVQSSHGKWAPNPAIINFEGLNNSSAVLPPDPNGDIGSDYYIQTVNEAFAIYSKAGELVFGPAGLGTIWQGMPGSYTSDGDPIVLHDHLAGRWVISQFSLPNFPNGPFYELIAVSQTSDPTGAWHRYAFQFSKMPDYPKFGVWPDGYYMSAKMFYSGSLNWAGSAAIVLERDSMLTGNQAGMIFFQMDASVRALLPADLDGQAPPSGSPGLFMTAVDDVNGGGDDRLELYTVHPDWVNPANSTISAPEILTTAPFDSDMCGWATNCIPQAGTSSRLDALSSLLMSRLQYRNFSTHETLVVNQTVDADATNHAGIRWYELRNSGAAWAIWQQGTYAPDSCHRWMGSTAMDGQGNIALAYSVSGSGLFPSIRATGRRVTDPPGLMTFMEEHIIDGGGAQTYPEGRWGDYSMLSVDPADEETFWYTNEYYASTGSMNWQTRIVSFTINDLQVGVPDLGPGANTSVFLNQNSPNPFSHATVISWQLAKGSWQLLKVYNIVGNEVATLVNCYMPAGNHSVEFNAERLPDGIYFYQLHANGIVETRKMILLK